MPGKVVKVYMNEVFTFLIEKQLTYLSGIVEERMRMFVYLTQQFTQSGNNAKNANRNIIYTLRNKIMPK